MAIMNFVDDVMLLYICQNGSRIMKVRPPVHQISRQADEDVAL